MSNNGEPLWDRFTNRDERPLSPFMLGQEDGYALQEHTAMSFLHRVTGIVFILIMLVMIWWFTAIASGPSSYAKVNGFLTHWFVVLFVLLGTVSACYHFCSGLRHLIWDAYPDTIGIEEGKKSAKIVQIGTIVLSLFFIIVAFIS